MPAYFIVEIAVQDAAAFEEYRRQVPATLARHGGRYLVRGGTTETLEGEGPAARSWCWSSRTGSRPGHSTTHRNTRRSRRCDFARRGPGCSSSTGCSRVAPAGRVIT